MFDADGSGTITHEELQIALAKLGHHATEREITQMMGEVDTDMSGGLSFDEFAAIVEKDRIAQNREERELHMRMSARASAAFDRRSRMTNRFSLRRGSPV